MNLVCRYDILSDRLDDVAIENNMNKQTSLEDEEALDSIDDIWQESGDNSSCVADNDRKYKFKVKKKDLMRPYVAYEPLNSNCDSLKTWGKKV